MNALNISLLLLLLFQLQLKFHKIAKICLALICAVSLTKIRRNLPCGRTGYLGVVAFIVVAAKGNCLSKHTNFAIFYICEINLPHKNFGFKKSALLAF